MLRQRPPSGGCEESHRQIDGRLMDEIGKEVPLATTGGNGVDVVYDSVGQATFASSLDCLRPMGLMVSFGQSSGSVPPLDLGVLGAKGSLFLTRPSLMTYTAKREELSAHAADLFEVVGNGTVKVEITRTYPLKEAAQAHRDLESRQTTGSIVLIPE